VATPVLHELTRERRKLTLESFKATGFRAFRDFHVPTLGRVNLFVGNNNVGKTSLLEAILMYATGITPGAIVDLLTTREELIASAVHRRRVDSESLDLALKRLFHLRVDGGAEPTFSLGAIDDEAMRITVRRGWVQVVYTDDDEPRLRFSVSEVQDLFGDQQRALQVQYGRTEKRIIRYERLLAQARGLTQPDPVLPATFVPAFGLDAVEIGVAWDRIALTDAEDLVRDALRIIAPDVDRISLVGDTDRSGDRKIVVRLRQQNAPVPLRSMGDGMARLLDISLALVNTQGGVLLLDEVENGIHYSVQSSMWGMIFDIADRLNVQVFATTHSWDCIKAFQAVANSRATVGSLHRLDRRGDDVVSVPFDEREMAIAAREQIEIR